MTSKAFPDLAIFCGSVFHTRHCPHRYRFRQSLLMFFVNTAYIDVLQKKIALLSCLGILNWRRKDYLPTNGSLTEAALHALHNCIGVRAAGPVYVLAQPRQFGVSYNPATFYFICHGDNTRAAYLLVEVHNTPWGERFCYAGRYGDDNNLDKKMSVSTMPKQHRVSPFNPLAMTYHWRYTQPQQKFYIHIRCCQEEAMPFDAVLHLHRRPFCRQQLYLALLQKPFSAGWAWMAIYWHAFNLWWKKTPFYREQFATRYNKK